MGRMQDLDIRIRNGGDDAIMAVRDLLGCPSYTDNGVAHELREYAKKLVVTDDDTAMAAELMRFAANYIDRLPSLRARWIPVSERLPDDDCQVLLWCPPSDEDEHWLTRCDIGRYIRSFRDSHVFYTDDGTVIPTHWMPLPEPPEVEK